MKIEGVCAHCNVVVSVTIALPTTFGAIESAVYDEHERLNSACNDGWFTDGLQGAAVTGTNPIVCRHADVGCECYLRCSCGWLVPSGIACPNPNHKSGVVAA